jgi:hypothetical protein
MSTTSAPGNPPQDDTPSYPASAAEMQRYAGDQAALSRFQAPVLIHQDNPHEYLYVACFDGTGNDKNKDAAHETNVGKISDQISERVEAGHHHIAQGYVAGPGTEDGWFRRTTDGADGYTYDTRLEKMYDLLIHQTAQWKHTDSDAKIRIAETGFSRGAEEAAGFARLVEERGIQDPAGAIYTRNSHGQITHVEYTRPPLMPPHQVAQAVALFDPVGTGAPEKEYDRRLPPSVISGIQLIATDERRGLFPSDRIIDPGETDDGRFLGLYVPGAHSDVGGGYLLNGLSNRSGNLVTEYLNSLSDTPFLRTQATPDNPAMDVIHRSEDGMLLYRLGHKVNRLSPNGYHTLEAPADQDPRTIKGDPYNAEPINQALNAQFERRPVPIGQTRMTQESRTPPQPGAGADLDRWIDQMYLGARLGNADAMDQAAQSYLQSTRGQAWQQQVQGYTQLLAREQEQTMQQQPAATRHHGF